VPEEVAFLGRFGVRTTQSGTGVPAMTARSRRAAPIQTRPTSHDQGIPGEGILVEADHAGRRAIAGPVEAGAMRTHVEAVCLLATAAKAPRPRSATAPRARTSRFETRLAAPSRPAQHVVSVRRS
jgi:hypothetical protein